MSTSSTMMRKSRLRIEPSSAALLGLLLFACGTDSGSDNLTRRTGGNLMTTGTGTSSAGPTGW